MKILFTNYHLVNSKSIKEMNDKILSLEKTVSKSIATKFLTDLKHHLADRLLKSADEEISRLTKELARIKGETNSFKIGDDFKIRVINQENSKGIQETLTKNSIDWTGWKGKNKVMFTDKPFLFVENNRISYSDEEATFNRAELPEFTLDQFYEIYKVTPKETNVEK